MQRVTLAVCLVLGSCAAACGGKLEGYTDAPVLPGQGWRVHDKFRPAPSVVVPAPYVQSAPPSDAVVLFDGKSVAAWEGAEGWQVRDGALIAEKGDIRTRLCFGDMQLHVEWMVPLPTAGGHVSERGNSGVYLLDQYEIQIFDNYGEDTIYADGMAGAVYGQTPPLVNASLPPEAWQTFDIVLTAPIFTGTNRMSGHVTVLHNGVVVQNNTELLGATQHRALPVVTPHPVPAPIRLQAHGSPVRFRNIWVRPLASTEKALPAKTESQN